MQQSWRPSSAKRARMEQSDVQHDVQEDSINVDCGSFSVTNPARDLADENTRHTTAVLTVSTSGDLYHKDGNFPGRFVDCLASTAMTAQEALSALDPAEKGIRSPQEGIQLSKNTVGPDSSFTPHRDPAPAWCSSHGNYRTNVISGSPTHSSPVSSVRPAAVVEDLAETGSLQPRAGPNTSQNDSFSRENPISFRQTTDRDTTNTPLSPIANNGHAILSSNPHQTENSIAKSESISRMADTSLDNTPKNSQAERRLFSLTTQVLGQASQNLTPPNYQPLFSDGFRSSPSNQSGKVTSSPGDSDLISEESYSPTSSENTRSSNSLERVIDAPQVATNPQNSSQNSGAGRQATAQQPPPCGRTDQDEYTESARIGTSGLPPNTQYRPWISYSYSNQKSAPPLTSLNRWSNNPPPPLSHHLYQNQSPPRPSISQNQWSNGQPPFSIATQTEGPSSRLPQAAPSLNPQYERTPVPPPQPPPSINTQHQTAFASPSYPPPPPLQVFSAQAQSPPNVAQYQAQLPSSSTRDLGPSSSHPTFAKQLIPLPSLPALTQDLGYPSNQPEPTQQRGPPFSSPSTQCHDPSATPAQCQAPQSHSSAPTQYRSPYPVDIPNSAPGSSSLQLPNLDRQQQPSPSPWDSSQCGGQPAPPPTQNQPVGPLLGSSASTFGSVYSNSRPSMASQESLETSAVLWEKYDKMVFIHVPVTLRTNTNLTNSGLRRYIFPAGPVFRKTVTEIFEWVSSILNTILPSQLVFEFLNVHPIRERGATLHQGDTNLLEAVKSTAWGYFRTITNLDPAVANVNILVTPYYPAAEGSSDGNMHQQPQQLHYTNAAWNTRSDPPLHAPSINQNGSSIASDSASHPSATKPGGPPPIGPPQQSQSSTSRSLTPDTINSHRGPSNTTPSSMTIPNKNNMPDGNITDFDDHLMATHATSNQNPQRQPQQQTTELQTLNNNNIDNSNSSTAKIVIRIQTDGHGKLSRSYDKSVLNARTTSERFFTWFEHETGGFTCSGRLKFEFKDALPTKSSVIARDNDDHFELMVHDIKRKFERAKEYMPDMNEFCIVVTDPEWNSCDENGDE